MTKAILIDPTEMRKPFCMLKAPEIPINQYVADPAAEARAMVARDARAPPTATWW